MNIEFNTGQYLLGLKNNNYKVTKEDHRIIDRLCKKIDVVKKVYSSYLSDMSAKTSETELDSEGYINLLALLMSAASSLVDFKFLNTALKLNDMLLKKGIVTKAESIANLEKLNGLLCSWSLTREAER